MFPYSDDLRGSGNVTGILVLVALVILAHVPAALDPLLGARIIQYFGFVPLWFSIAPWANVHRLFSSVFLHVDVFHLGGNCLFLWVFGRSLQRLFGVRKLLLIFPCLGVVGLLLHWVIYPQSNMLVVGASGAVATLMGAYLALFPSARIKLFVLIGSVAAPITAPAWVFLFYWAGFELLSLILDLGEGGDRIAYAVHVGGFIAGVMAAIIWKVTYPYAEEQLLEFTRDAVTAR